MLRIIDETSTGKTRQLLEAAAADNGIILSKNPEALRHKAQAYGIIGIKDFISLPDVMFDNDLHHENIYVDEIEELVTQMLSLHNFKGYTLSKDR